MEEGLTIYLSNEPHKIRLTELDERYMTMGERPINPTEMYEYEQKFFRLFPIAHKIASIFNYVYLPLNRNTMQVNHENEMYSRMRKGYRSVSTNYGGNTTNYLNESISYIEGLIIDNYVAINTKEIRINDDFRKEVLTSSISVTAKLELERLLEELDKLSWKDILRKKQAYIKT